MLCASRCCAHLQCLLCQVPCARVCLCDAWLPHKQKPVGGYCDILPPTRPHLLTVPLPLGSFSLNPPQSPSMLRYLTWLVKLETWARKMAQQARESAVKCPNSCSITGTHRGRRELTPTRGPLAPRVHCDTHTHI